MSWIIEANKLGRYHGTYLGFRVYFIKEPSHTERIEQRGNDFYRITDFIKGELIAVDKYGNKCSGYNLEDIGWEIDKADLEKHFAKQK